MKWIIDPIHSDIFFKVRHMMITNVSGTFEKYEAEMTSDDISLKNTRAFFKAQVATVNTRNDQRDAHLRSNDFFQADDFPSLEFVSKKFEQIVENEYTMIGDITIKGITKSISFQVKKTGHVKDSWGHDRIGFEISGMVLRSDFNLTWNAPTMDGGVALAEEIYLTGNVEMIQQ